MTIQDVSDFSIPCTGDVVAGDTIQWTEAVFDGAAVRGRFGRARARFLGERTVTADVLRDSYGADRQQHTFTLRVLACEGVQPIAPGTQTTRKGRTIYRNGTRRRPWEDESARVAAAAEKHARGDDARAIRDARRAGELEGVL